jgi:hypothetical protein
MGKLINFSIFHKIGSYIHGTRGFVHQIFLNIHIGGFIESNKREIFENFADFQLRKLLLSMAHIIHRKCPCSF